MNPLRRLSRTMRLTPEHPGPPRPARLCGLLRTFARLRGCGHIGISMAVSADLGYSPCERLAAFFADREYTDARPQVAPLLLDVARASSSALTRASNSALSFSVTTVFRPTLWTTLSMSATPSGSFVPTSWSTFSSSMCRPPSSSAAIAGPHARVRFTHLPNTLRHQGILATPPYSNPKNVRHHDRRSVDTVEL
jgi:hypothetical protein